MISCPLVRRVFLRIPSPRMCAWREPQGTCNPFLTHRHSLFLGFNSARPSVSHSSCICFSAFEMFWAPKGIPSLLRISYETFGATRQTPAGASLGQDLLSSSHWSHQGSCCLLPSLFFFFLTHKIEWSFGMAEVTMGKKNWIWDTVWTESQLDLVTSYRKRKLQSQLLELNFKDFLHGEWMRKLPLGISWNMKSYGAGEIHDWHTFYKVGGPGLHISRSKEKSYICECHYLAVCNHTDLWYMQKVDTKKINRQIDSRYFV